MEESTRTALHNNSCWICYPRGKQILPQVFQEECLYKVAG